jgi:hypothetical protein
MKYTSGEFIMILSLPEIVILDLCLVLHISRSIIALDEYVGFLALFWTRETVRESLGPEVLYLFLYVFILFVVNRNAIFDIFNFL